MNNKILFILSWGIFIISIVSAQTIVPGGIVSGTWTAAGSPYNVQENITIPTDSTLTIEAGVEVIFQGFYTFRIYGSMHANGTSSDSIYFVPADTTTRWDGIEFRDTNGSLTYTNVSYTASGYGAIYFYNSTVDLSHCTIHNNTGQGAGGLDISNGSRVTVSHCSIIRNSAIDYGGGIGLRDSSYLSISNSEISFNQHYEYGSTRMGGGIWSSSSDSLIVDSCIFRNNRAGDQSTSYSNGGAIGVYWGNGFVNISNSSFLHNIADMDGGALYLTDCQAIITGNNFDSNAALLNGVAVYLENCNATLSYNIFQRNISIDYVYWYPVYGIVFLGDSSFASIDHCNFHDNGSDSPIVEDKTLQISSSASVNLRNTIFSDNRMGIVFEAGCSAQVEYNNFYNYYYNFEGSVPAGLGTLSGTNVNGDSCDTFYNIYMDPLFVDAVTGDFNLQSSSPCIDAGDPSSPLDPDSTIADMGAYFFDQLFPVIYVNQDSLEFGDVEIGTQKDTTFKIFNQGSDSLIINQIISGSAVFTTNFNPGNNFILPNDSMLITVTFTPTDSGFVDDTLIIDNNAQLVEIYLSGFGKTPVGIVDELSNIPKEFALYAAYPNPFNPTTTIKFDLPKYSFVDLKIYNLLGEEVSTLISKDMNAGRYKYIWNANNLASGVYFYRLNAGEYNKSGKVILVR